MFGEISILSFHYPCNNIHSWHLVNQAFSKDSRSGPQPPSLPQVTFLMVLPLAGPLSIPYLHNEMLNVTLLHNLITSSYSVIVHVRVVLKRPVLGKRHIDNPSGSDLQSQVNSVCQAMML